MGPTPQIPRWAAQHSRTSTSTRWKALIQGRAGCRQTSDAVLRASPTSAHALERVDFMAPYSSLCATRRLMHATTSTTRRQPIQGVFLRSGVMSSASLTEDRSTFHIFTTVVSVRSTLLSTRAFDRYWVLLNECRSPEPDITEERKAV